MQGMHIELELLHPFEDFGQAAGTLHKSEGRRVVMPKSQSGLCLTDLLPLEQWT